MWVKEANNTLQKLHNFLCPMKAESLFVLKNFQADMSLTSLHTFCSNCCLFLIQDEWTFCLQIFFKKQLTLRSFGFVYIKV